MGIRLLESASRDLTEGYHFYERQQEGLGAHFLDTLFADITHAVTLATSPHSWPLQIRGEPGSCVRHALDAAYPTISATWASSGHPPTPQ